MAAQSARSFVVGDYVVGRQIGAGSFSTVWQARHRTRGFEVAIKEINTARLNPKLQESLKSEIFILKRIEHPNIIRLHDMIEEPGKIYIILEYCKGGDLSMYIQQRHGKIPEATAKHFMQQLAEGLKVLHQNNLMHRDLKPQNLLLSTNANDSILKIADFGFARSLQPSILAETLCGSPLFMAPEIMMLQKYDSKADLWSVGIILFQLVTGKTPFTGSNQIQLIQNIMKSGELQFPPEAKDLSPDCLDLCRKLLRRNPVERLTFEEFFNHPYLSDRQPEESIRNRQSERSFDDFPLPRRNSEESSQDDYLPFILDDDSSGPDGNPSFPGRPAMKSMYGFSLDSRPVQGDTYPRPVQGDTYSRPVQGDTYFAKRTDSSKYGSNPRKTETTKSSLGSHKFAEGNLKESLKLDLGSLDNSAKVLDSLESIVRDYVIVSGPPLDLSSSEHASKPNHFSPKTGRLPPDSGNINVTRGTVPVIVGAIDRVGYSRSVESHMAAPTASPGSLDIAKDQPSNGCLTRIKSLQHCASLITELVNEKIETGKQLEAFSIQLVILAIWKQALDICHTYAASATEGSSSQDIARSAEVSKVLHSPHAQTCLGIDITRGPQDISSQIERAFLHEVGNAEDLGKMIEPGNMEMPDAMELIYQSALAWGKRGAVDEYMGDSVNAVVFYSKAVRLLLFLLDEAPCLILNPPFSLTNSDRYRIQNYIDAINNRQSISQSQRMALFKA